MEIRDCGIGRARIGEVGIEEVKWGLERVGRDWGG